MRTGRIDGCAKRRALRQGGEGDGGALFFKEGRGRWGVHSRTRVGGGGSNKEMDVVRLLWMLVEAASRRVIINGY